MLSTYDTNYLSEFKKKNIDNCSLCKGTNYSCSCWNNYRLEIRKIKASIPVKYRTLTLDDINHPQIKEAKKEVEDYIASLDKNRKAGNGLYLGGSPGLAKTALACIILKEALKKGYTTYYFESLSYVLDVLMNSWGREAEEADLFSERVLKTDFIVIDEVGSEHRPNSQLVESTFRRLFRERSGNLLPIILVSNFDENSVGSVYGQQLLSLFGEHLKVISFKGVDYRKEVVKKAKRHG